MKKIYSIVLFLIMLIGIAGCGKLMSKGGTLVCTNETVDDNNYITKETVTVTYNSDNIVTKMESKTEMEVDPNFIDFTYDFSKAVFDEFDKINGIEATVSKKDNVILQDLKVDIKNLDFDALNKLSTDYFDDEETDSDYISNITNEEITLEQFKKDNLSGYECK